jgi:hypothetical protein
MASFEPTRGKQTLLHRGRNILAACALVRHPHSNKFLVIDLSEKEVWKMLFSGENGTHFAKNIIAKKQHRTKGMNLYGAFGTFFYFPLTREMFCRIANCKKKLRREVLKSE